MSSLLVAVAVLFFVHFTAATAQCVGEFSVCPDGSCALVPQTECAGKCSGKTLYACPLSQGLSCFDGKDFLASCPNLKGTHFDTSLSIEERLDYIFSGPWSVEEYISQMTENATHLSRFSIPAYSYLNDDQHGVKQPDATAFPNGASLGATWDPALLTAVGLAIGTEARGVHSALEDKSGETGGHSWPGTIRNGVGLTLYAPNVNLGKLLPFLPCSLTPAHAHLSRPTFLPHFFLLLPLQCTTPGGGAQMR